MFNQSVESGTSYAESISEAWACGFVVLRQLNLVVATGSVTRREQSVARRHVTRLCRLLLPPLEVSLLLHLYLTWCAKNKRPWSDPFCAFDVPRSAIITGPSPHVTGSSTDAGSDTDLKWWYALKVGLKLSRNSRRGLNPHGPRQAPQSHHVADLQGYIRR